CPAAMAGRAHFGGPGDVHPAPGSRANRRRARHGIDGGIRVVSPPEKAGPVSSGGGDGHDVGPAVRKAWGAPHVPANGVGDRSLPIGDATGEAAPDLREGLTNTSQTDLKICRKRTQRPQKKKLVIPFLRSLCSFAIQRPAKNL